MRNLRIFSSTLLCYSISRFTTSSLEPYYRFSAKYDLTLFIMNQRKGILWYLYSANSFSTIFFPKYLSSFIFESLWTVGNPNWYLQQLQMRRIAPRRSWFCNVLCTRMYYSSVNKVAILKCKYYSLIRARRYRCADKCIFLMSINVGVAFSNQSR